MVTLFLEYVDAILDSDDERMRVNDLADSLFSDVAIVFDSSSPVNLTLRCSARSTQELCSRPVEKPEHVFWDVCPTSDVHCSCVSTTLSRELMDR